MKLAVPSATQVTYDQLRWMSVCLALALAVHAASLPVWLLAAIAAAVAIRLALAARGYAAPSRTIRIVVAVVSIGILFLQLHTFNGVAAGSALLSLVAGLKLFETQSRRDLYVIALIIYFLSLAALLRSESFWLFAYLLAVSWLTSATLLRLSDSTQPSDWRQAARATRDASRPRRCRLLWFSGCSLLDSTYRCGECPRTGAAPRRALATP